jgi:hypothetical protein
MLPTTATPVSLERDSSPAPAPSASPVAMSALVVHHGNPHHVDAVHGGHHAPAVHAGNHGHVTR